MQTLLTTCVFLAIASLGAAALAQTAPGAPPGLPGAPPLSSPAPLHGPGTASPAPAGPGADPRGSEPLADAFRIGVMRSSDGDARLDVVRRHVPGAPPDTYRLQFQVFKEGPRPRFQMAEPEAAQLPALMDALERMSKIAAGAEPPTADAPVGYRGGAVSVTLSPDGGERNLFVQAGTRARRGWSSTSTIWER